MGYTKEQLSLVSTGTLPSEVSEVLRQAAIERYMEVLKLRQYGFVDTSPDEGQQTYIYNVLNELSNAKEVGEGAEPDYEDADATKGSQLFIKIMKAFKISWEADALKTINLRAGQTRAAVDQVYEYEDSKIIKRLEADRASTAAGTDWSGASADPVKDVRTAMRTVRALGYVMDKMALDPVNYEELCSIIASNSWYSVTEQLLKKGATETIPFMGLKIEEVPDATLGTATLFKSGTTGSFMTAEAKKVGLNIFDDKDAQTTKVQVYERVVPAAVVRADSAYCITGL